MTAHASVEGHHDYAGLHRYGLWMFIISEAFLFAVLIGSRFALLGFGRPDSVNQLLGLGLTVILVSSSFLVHRAEGALGAGSRQTARLYLLGAVGLAAVFVWLAGLEWATGFVEFPPSTPYGSTFFLITGTHLLHLIIGALVLLALYVQAGKDLDAWKLHGGALYWHFVDVVWLTVYATLYLL